MKKILLALVAAATLMISLAPAMACNTTLLTDKNGNVVFPICPPNQATPAPGTLDNTTIGSTTPAPGSFTNLSAAGQITSKAGLPTIASGACGTTTNGAVVAGSTNQAGSITIGSASTTSCTISWSATLASAPKACIFMAMNAAAIAATTLPYVGTPGTTSVVLNGAVLASTNWSFICL